MLVTSCFALWLLNWSAFLYVHPRPWDQRHLKSCWFQEKTWSLIRKDYNQPGWMSGLLQLALITAQADASPRGQMLTFDLRSVVESRALSLVDRQCVTLSLFLISSLSLVPPLLPSTHTHTHALLSLRSWLLADSNMMQSLRVARGLKEAVVSRAQEQT